MSDPKQPGAHDRQVEIDDLDVGKETISDLTEAEAEGIEGGAAAKNTAAKCSNPCPKTVLLCPHKTTVPAGCPSTVVKG